STLYDTVLLLSIVAAIVAGVWLCGACSLGAEMDDTMCSNGLLGYFTGARLGRSQDIGGAHGRVDQSLSLFRPDIVVADYAPTANTFFNSVIEQLVGLARRHAVPVIYMRRELHRMRLDGDTPTTRSRPTRPAFSARRTCASLPWPRRCRLSRQLLDG